MDIVNDETTTTTDEKLHACEIKLTFPTPLQAQQVMQVLSVDAEPTTRVSKSFRIDNEGELDDKKTYMLVRFESKEVKMLRVAISSFYDYLTLVIRTLQEFDTSMES